jgi:hypothetical protein
VKDSWHFMPSRHEQYPLSREQKVLRFAMFYYGKASGRNYIYKLLSLFWLNPQGHLFHKPTSYHHSACPKGIPITYSWHAIKDSLTHRPSSQGWAPGVLPFYVQVCCLSSVCTWMEGWGVEGDFFLFYYLFYQASML